MQTVFDVQPAAERFDLDRAGGYRVETARGRLGVVEGVEPSDAVLRIRARSGRELLLVPYELVAFVDPHERRVILRRRP